MPGDLPPLDKAVRVNVVLSPADLRRAYIDGAWAGAFLVALLAGAAFVVLLARGVVP